MRTVAESPPADRIAFARGTAARLGIAAVGFLVLGAITWAVIPEDDVRACAFEWPLLPGLLALSLTAAALARWWAETEQPRPLTALALHAATQALSFAVFVKMAPGWAMLFAALALTASVGGISRTGRFYGAGQVGPAALALSAHAFDPVWYVGRLVGCLFQCRD